MHLHSNAVLTVRQRRRLVELVAVGVTITAVRSKRMRSMIWAAFRGAVGGIVGAIINGRSEQRLAPQ